jgi:UDP-N-acetylglucosamine 4,6-dehydratase
MISTEDARRTLKRNDRYVVLPTLAEWGWSKPSGDDVEDGFAYTSDKNDQWLNVQDIEKLLSDLGL